MSIVAAAQKAIVASFNGPLKEFVKEVNFDYLSSAGEYDPETDSTTPVYTTEGPFKVPCLRPTTEDMDKLGVEVSDLKIIVPGNYLSKSMETSDQVRIGTEVWKVRKTVGVPGEVIYTIYVRRT